MPSKANTRSLAIVFLIVLLVANMPAQVAGQAPPTRTVWVTYVNSTPTTTNTGETLDIIFHVVHFTCDSYLGSNGCIFSLVTTARYFLELTDPSNSSIDLGVCK